MKRELIGDLKRFKVNGNSVEKRQIYGEVYIPSGVREISDYCFYRDGMWQAICLPDTLEKIGELAFAGGFYGESINLPKTLKEIGRGAFNDCPNLKYIVVPGNLKKISQLCFNFCYNLVSVTIDEGVQEIGDFAFSFCRKLSHIQLPSTIKKIGENAFSGIKVDYHIYYAGTKKDFENIDWIERNKYVDKVIFEKKMDENEFIKTGLDCVDFGYDEMDAKEMIAGRNIISRCNGVVIAYGRDDLIIKDDVIMRRNEPKHIIITRDIVSIEDFCFDKENVVAVELPDTLKEIKFHSFSGFAGESITLPKGLEKIGHSAFINSAIKKIEVPGSVKTIGGMVFGDCVDLEEVILNEGTEKIESFAFCGCKKLKSIRLPKSIVEVQAEAFRKCGLKEIIVEDDSKEFLKYEMKMVLEKLK